jgi:hypothetical protein
MEWLWSGVIMTPMAFSSPSVKHFVLVWKRDNERR